MESAYIHIPFCKKICSYCDFCKMYYKEEWALKYLQSLVLEIHEKYNGEEIKTLYIGGGTPSCLGIKELNILFDIVKELNLSSDLEFTFECNVEDINNEMLIVLRKNRVNRLSIGIESFNENKQNFMGRHYTFEEVEKKIKMCREIGFKNINLDLMYGIPNETVKDLKKDIDLLLKLDPEHISTYSLIVEDNTRVGISGVVPIPEELDASMYELVCDKLEDKNYVHYEVSNFCKKGYECKHNLHYWNNDEYYGFGIGASGYVDGVRYDNTRSLTDYFKGVIRKKEEILSKEDKMYNELMLGFRKMEGISLKEFFRKYEVNMQDVFDLREVLKEDELIVDDEYIYVNPQYIYVMNEILIKII